jgi:hypothetical protein
MELVSLKGVSLDLRTLLLKELGYSTDGEFILNSSGNKVIDKYLDIPVKLNNMIIFPGSEIILDDNELSISSYMEEYGDVFG